MLREYIGDRIHIDGRMIGYRIASVNDYFEQKGFSKEEINNLKENHYEMCQLINQIIAVKQSCWLLRRTSYSCGSLSDDMYQLKLKLMLELKEKYNYVFDDDLMEEYCGKE